MKKTVILGLSAIILSSCATIFGGAITESQKTKPKNGEQQRQVRVVPLVADIIFFWPGLIVDFATGAMYKPGTNNTVAPKKAIENEKMF